MGDTSSVEYSRTLPRRCLDLPPTLLCDPSADCKSVLLLDQSAFHSTFLYCNIYGCKFCYMHFTKFRTLPFYCLFFEFPGLQKKDFAVYSKA